MKPVAQIFPGVDLRPEEVINYAEDQDQYITMPMWKGPDGQRVSRWKLSWRERLRVLLGGSLWLSVLTFDRALQPMRLDTSCPLDFSHRDSPEWREF